MMPSSKYYTAIFCLISFFLPTNATFIGTLYLPRLLITHAIPRSRQQNDAIICMRSWSTPEFRISHLMPFLTIPHPHYLLTSTHPVTFNDPNTNDPASCNVTWPSTSTPPSTTYTCSDPLYRFNFPSGTYKSISDFQLNLIHTFEDPA
jgi:hypothetical protein